MPEAQSTLVPTGTEAGNTPSEYRLPTDVRPKHYNMVIKTNLLSCPPSFSGESIVGLEVINDTSSLTLNAHSSLKITHCAISSGVGDDATTTVLTEEELGVDADRERVKIDLSRLPGAGLKAGTAGVKLWMRFEAALSVTMGGYYKSEGAADSHSGQKQVYALTHFEPTSARKAFPCWDEPLLKATFKLSMIAHENKVTLANMPEIRSGPWTPKTSVTRSEALSPGYALGSLLTDDSAADRTSAVNWKITEFDITPPMSTYLVGYACGDFASLHAEYKSEMSGRTIPLSFYTTQDLIKQGQFSLDVVRRALPIYEEMFDISYNLPKLDTLAAHDFDNGAMENWGLIIGRTEKLLCDPASGALASQKRVANTQCHEVAHMWFGNLVTMKWWDNLWLKEAFATFIGEMVVADRLWPEWNFRDDFVLHHWTRALSFDAQHSSHPIEVDCPDANNINQIFDHISYYKGASVLRMLSAVVGEQAFLKGVSIYLKKHLFGNAETADLWEGIGEASSLDVNVGSVMENWVSKVGFPFLTVEEQGGGKIKITQHRFLSIGDAKADEDETIWWIPLAIKTVNNGHVSAGHTAILSDRSIELDLGKVDSFKLNAETIGVYRVAYSPERLLKLGEDAAHYSVQDRIGLISDAAALARAGYAKTSGSLDLIAALAKSERDYLPWSQISDALGGLADVWWEQPAAVREGISKFQVDLFRPILDRLGYDHGADDAPEVKELRKLAIRAMADAGDAGATAELRGRFNRFMTDNDDSGISPDLQRVIFVTAAQHGGEEEYAKLLQVFQKPSGPSTRVDAIFALCSTASEELLDKTLEMMEDGSVKNQDISWYFVSALAENHKARRKLVGWFKANYDDLIQRFGDGFGIASVVQGVFESLSSHEDLADAKAFFADKDITKFESAVFQAYDAIQASADWLARDSDNVQQWLKANHYL